MTTYLGILFLIQVRADTVRELLIVTKCYNTIIVIRFIVIINLNIIIILRTIQFKQLVK